MSLSTITLVVGCASKQLTIEQLYGQIPSGTLAGCNIDCRGKLEAKRKEMKDLYKTERWEVLARIAFEVGYGHPLTFFYLARAADGLGLHKKATDYYQSLVASWETPRCNEKPECDNLYITGLAFDRIDVLNGANWLEREAASRQDLFRQDKQELEIPAALYQQDKSEALTLTRGHQEEISLTLSQGVYEVPVEINDVLKINVILDSGAAEVSIAPEVALTLIRTGTIKKSDWLPGKTYAFADGSTALSYRFMIRRLKIGGYILSDVPTRIASSTNAPMLLGQSALEKLGRYTIDYNKGILQMESNFK